MAQYRKTQISGPIKRFMEGTAGVFAILAVFIIIGSYLNDDLAKGLVWAAVFGGISAVFAVIAGKIPSKTQYTEK